MTRAVALIPSRKKRTSTVSPRSTFSASAAPVYSTHFSSCTHLAVMLTVGFAMSFFAMNSAAVFFMLASDGDFS